MSSNLQKYDNPTYDEVCSGETSLVEVYQMKYLENDQKGMEMYKKLVWHYFSFHDPTTSNRQGLPLHSSPIVICLRVRSSLGLDCGPQYASTIFYYNDQQRQIAEDVIQKLQSFIDLKQNHIRYVNRQILTSLIEASKFYPAEEPHQNYLLKNPGGYCNHYYRFDWSQLINK
jgi:peptide-methionine (S)-S-oxide reductase